MNIENNPDPSRMISKLTKETLEAALKNALKTVDKNIGKFGEKFPSSASQGLSYLMTENVEWTTSFWTGMLWLAYEVTHEKKYYDLAHIHIKSFKDRLENKIDIDHHDLGFLYTLSCVNAYKITQNQEAKEIALKAADYLLTRYHEKAGIIQAWGDLNDESQRGRMIIDCNMNLPLLYWATGQTGDWKYIECAISHINQAAKYLVRDDFSTYHTFYMDPLTGKPLRGTTCQGYSDTSCWARGQAWAIYGFCLSYNYTKDVSLIELSRKIAHYFLDRLPEDRVCYWDLIFTEGTEERDSSAAAIAVCGLLELVKALPVTDPDYDYFLDEAKKMMISLMEYYAPDNDTEAEGLLIHSVYNKPGGRGVDECTLWGDYFYLEALVRMTQIWNSYW
ncbi:MAG: glucuronyl hydrolase [Clostridia bacterium]|jgi:unsaturated chondroitin disaccharide hydrolase|nr:glucuronyl hydrolase [Clostridia bacterium]